jgi:filamentous hemagglutinin family protein
MTRLPAARRRPFPGRPGGVALALVVAFGADPSVAAPPLLPGTVAGRQVWSGAEVSGGNGVSELLIRQTVPRAQLYWDRFDVDRGQTVRFDQQGNRNWVALNWIGDARPSVIAGRLLADGQVYLINRNGIVFKPGAQVDASSFIASTLALQEDAFVRGLTALRDGRATFERSPGASADARIEVQSGPVTTLAGRPVLGPDGQQLVEAARISSADGGRVFLFATREVVNQGIVSSPNGQVVLAAGHKVYLFAPTNQDSAAFRGLFVEVSSGGEARNLGTIVTDRGNTSLVGLAVNNEGRISARSALSGNGSVWLLARSDLPEQFDVAGRPTPQRAGTVTLGPRSRIELPSVSEQDANGRPLTAIDAQQVFPSEVRIEGRDIALRGDAQGGATITAPGGRVSIVASDAPIDPEAADAVRPVGAARVTVDAGATISVAGVRDVAAPVSRNLLDIELRGENLGDNVALRSPQLAGSTLRVDVRDGSPLFSRETLDRAAAQQIGRTVEERASAGGAIRIQSDGDALVAPGARFDLSGGSVRYEAGVLTTSTVFDGLRTFDVSQAPADRVYQRADTFQITDPRWGVTRSWSFGVRGRRDPGYLEGRDAGSLQLDAPYVAMGGEIDGGTIAGSRQRAAPPAGALLTFGNQRAYQQANPDFRLAMPVRFERPATPPQVDATADRARLFGDAAAPRPLQVDADALAARGVSRIEVFTNDRVTVPEGSGVRLPAGGRLTIAAGAGAELRGDVVVPGARDAVVATVGGRAASSRGIDVSGVLVQGSSVENAPRPVDVTVAGATVSAAGQWVVDREVPAPDGAVSPAVVDAGRVRLASPTAVSVDARSTIDVQAGARLASNRTVSTGAAGRIELLSTDPGSVDRPARGRMTVDGTLSGYGFIGGGALRVDAADVTISDGPVTAGFGVRPSFFLTGGFADYDLRGLNALSVAPGTSIRPTQSNRRIESDGVAITDADALRAASPIVVRPGFERRPVSVALRATSPYRSVLSVGAGSGIAVEPGGRIALESAVSMDVAGRLSAPGGQVVASVGRPPGSTEEYRGFRGTQGLYVAPGAEASVDGVDATERGPAGRILGSVLPGGSIAFDAWDGYLVLDAGSRFSARGTSGTVLAPTLDGPQVGAIERVVPTAGGTVRFGATNGGALAPRVDLASGGTGAAHGALEIRVPDLQVGSTGEFGSIQRGVQTTSIVADRDAIPSGVRAGVDLDRLRNGPPATEGGDAPPRPVALTIAAGSVESDAPRERLRIDARDRIEFVGDARLGASRELRLDAPVIAVAADPARPAPTVSITAPHVALGNGRATTVDTGAATPGRAELRVTAPVAIDLIGELAIQGAERTRLSTDGDLRLLGLYRDQSDAVLPYADGRLSAHGSVELIARRLFPTTFTRYAIEVLGDGSTLRTVGAGAGIDAPLSAGGALSMRAATIDLGGRTFVPQGTFDADASGSLTLRDGARVSVAGGELPVPLGDTQDRRRIVYGFTQSSTRSVTELPRAVSLAGESVRLEAGSTVDASGGGEVIASSFVAGSRGSGDLLRRPNVYAVVPGLAGAAPHDTVAQREMIAARDPASGGALAPFRGAMPASVGVGSSPAVSVGDQVWLSGSAALPAGLYTLLPARYALLPGAVTVVATTARDAGPARNAALSDGSHLVAGYRVAEGAGPRDTRWSTFNVLPSATVATYGEYVIDTGSRFFAAEAARAGVAAPRLPADAGLVALTARGAELDLSGSIALRGAAATDARGAGRAGELEVAARRIAVTEGASPDPSFVAVQADRIRATEAERVLIGGRSGTASAPAQDGPSGVLETVRTVTAVAEDVRVETGTQVTAQSIGLVATGRVTLAEGASVVARGDRRAGERLSTGGAAFVGASSDPGERLSAAEPSAATVVLGTGSALQGAFAGIAAPGGASIPDATTWRVQRLSLSGDRIELGTAVGPDAPGSILLSQSLLAALSGVDAMSLNATRALVLGGGVRIGGEAFGTLAVQAPAIVHAGGAGEIGIDAGRFAWSWRGAAVPPTAASAPEGSLRISARASTGDRTRDGVVVLGEGERRLSGFARTEVSAIGAGGPGGRISLEGDGSTATDGALSLAAGAIVAGAGATQRIASDVGIRTSAAGPASSATGGPGGRIAMSAPRLEHGATLRAPSGDVRLEATGPDRPGASALTVAATGAIDARGALAEVAGTPVGLSGGQVTLAAPGGSVTARPGSTIDVSAAPGGGSAGTVRVQAPTGAAAIGSTIEARAPAGAEGGRLAVDSASIADPSALLREARRGGVDGAVDLRVRTGPLALSGEPGERLVVAREVTLATDTGALTLAGVAIDAGGADGGRVALHAGGRVEADARSSIAARGDAGRGGEVLLSGRDGVSFAPGARIDTGGTETGGIVDVRIPAPLLAAPGSVSIAPGTIAGAREARMTFVQRYDGIGEVTGATPGAGRLALTDAFAAASALVTPAAVATATSRLGAADASLVRLRPDIEVRSAVGGDIRVDGALDLSGVRFTSVRDGDTAGTLSLLADRNLLLRGGPTSAGSATAVLNDGFGGTGAAGSAANAAAPFMADAASTWSYRLVAGADRGAASPSATRAPTDPALGASDGRIALGQRQSIRTGTGSIELSAARDIVLGVASPAATEPLDRGIASIFTAGRAADPLPGFVDPTSTGVTLRPAYTRDGGDITLRAGGSVLAAESGAIASTWLFRSGEVTADGTLARPRSPVSWWPEFRYFTQSVGALGGGTVRIEAAGDVRNVSAAVASSGRVSGAVPSATAPVVTGGGRLDVRAGGSVDGGSFTVMRGRGRIVAGEGVGSARQLEGEPVFALIGLGDARVDVEARRDLAFERAYNPTLAPQSLNNARTDARRSHFSTYGTGSQVTLTSLSGDVDLVPSDPRRLADDSGSSLIGYNGRDVPFALSPGRLVVRAPGGDVTLRVATPGGANVPSVMLAPSVRGQLDVVAGGSIRGTGSIDQSDADPREAFGPGRPFGAVTDLRALEFGTGAHALRPVHRDDPEPSRLVAGRDIATADGATTPLAVTTAEAIDIRAGRDVRNVILTIQNVRPDDVSKVAAGRDIVNENQTNALGRLLQGDTRGITVTGPGAVELRAARDIAMGTSRGIVTRGNLDNAALPERGASIVLIAGLPDDPAYDAFLARYVDPAATGGAQRYDDALVDFVARATGARPADAAQAWSALQSLPSAQRGELARSVFFLELRTAGRAASDPANPRFRDFQRAYDAMSVMFPNDGAGNVDLVFSQVRTERGGDVQMLVPGVVCRGAASACDATAASQSVGNVFVGLTSPPVELAQGKPASQLGIFTLQGGDIQAAVGNDVAVNRSRILTVAGGGITLFSALGDIDAGRGSKSATSAPPPLVRVDQDGNIVVELPGVVEGSGIGVLVTQAGVVPGDIDLFAPKGVIDAGEAGIRAAGNITVFATQVLNASNIQVSGASTGVPTVAAAPNLSLASTSSSAASATRGATDSAERAASEGGNRPRSSQRLLILEFLGFGDEGEDAYQRRRSRAR